MPKNFQSPAIRTTTRIFPFLKIKIFSPSLFSLAPLSPPNLHSHCLASSPELPDITNSKKIGLCLVKKPQNYLSFSLLPTPKPKDFLPFPTSDIAKKFSSLFLFIYLYFLHLICIFFFLLKMGLSFYDVGFGNIIFLIFITKSYLKRFYSVMGWEHLMLQDLYDDGFGFAGLL